MPEFDPELPDDGLPDEIEEEEDEDDPPCASPADIWRPRTEDLGDSQSR